MTRTGKIARLPSSIRELLNRRLRNGEQGVKVMKWLNGLPKVQEVLAEEFGGRPISEQNISEWKLGGFEDWLRHQETRSWVRALADESADLEEDAGDFSVSDWLSAPLAVALGRWIHEIAAEAPNDPAQRKMLLVVARELAELRRSDHGAERLRIDRERWEAEQQEKTRKEMEKLRGQAEGAKAYLQFFVADVKRQYKDKVAAGPLSPEEEAKFQRIFAKVAEWERSPEAGTPLIAPCVSHQAESNSIQPNQTDAHQTR
jgi:hypothetical protein